MPPDPNGMDFSTALTVFDIGVSALLVLVAQGGSWLFSYLLDQFRSGGRSRYIALCSGWILCECIRFVQSVNVTVLLFSVHDRQAFAKLEASAIPPNMTGMITALGYLSIFAIISVEGAIVFRPGKVEASA